ncbi:hypothetical protein OF83DRAFT_511569 [Amylostereum chailletii]|nr:hypothetical protein OF83DRAFT_511569 [Amylostereum chailletii]
MFHPVPNSSVARKQGRPLGRNVKKDPPQSGGNPPKKSKRRRKGGKKPSQAESPGCGGPTLEEIAATVKELQAKLARQRKERQADMATLREERVAEVKAMLARDEVDASRFKSELVLVREQIQDLHTRTYDLRDAFLGDPVAKLRLTRTLLLDYGRDAVTEKAYGMPEHTPWIPFSRRFTSVEVFVVDARPRCQDKGINFSQDALKKIWEGSIPDVETVTAQDHSLDKTEMRIEQAVLALPADSIDRKVSVEIFTCAFGRPPA